MRRKIYLASSWRNKYYESTLEKLQQEHEVYDFKNPAPGNNGFQWSQINHNWNDWNTNSFITALKTPVANKGFKFDFNALNWCDTGVLLLPSGRSAHLEAGYLIGKNKPVYVYIPEYTGPDLMYKLATGITDNLNQLMEWLK